MKNCSNFLKYLAIVVVVLLFGMNLNAEETKLLEISGHIKNYKGKKPVENVSVSVSDTNIATVTNADGYFVLKVREDLISKGLKVEQIGFNTLSIPLSSSALDLNDLEIFMKPSGKVLDELFVLGGDPKEIVRQALIKIPQNYSDKENLFSGFYRETISKGKRFINISEGMVDVVKKPYSNRNILGEKVRISRGRSLVSPKPSDTLAVKLMGGPFMPVALDAVKNAEHLFSIDEINLFDFKMEPSVMIDDKVHYVISFRPQVSRSYPLHSGVFYIDGETLAINRVEFQLDMKDKAKVSRSILQKKPSGLNFKPIEVSGVATYKTIDGKSYLNYLSSKVRFKCDWKKRLFSSTYTSLAEMVMVDRNDEVKNVKFSDSFSGRKIFSDIVTDYWDENFWKDYNILEPTESLEKAIDKLKKK